MALYPFNSWTANLFRRHREWLSPWSVIAYRNYLVRDASGRLTPERVLALRLRGPISGMVYLREMGSDMNTLDEIVNRRVYGDIVRYVSPCQYIVDIGANIGLASRFFATQVPDCRILAIEPDGANYRMLERNLAKFVESGRCTITRTAVWSRAIELSVFASTGVADNYEGMAVREKFEQGDQVVDGMTMKDVLASSGFPRIDLVKIDIEGAETEIFHGDLAWLDRVQAIAIEFHENTRSQSRFDEVVQDRGFEIKDLNPHTVLALRNG